MNWNEWRMKWFLFWLFIAMLLILTVGCSYQEPPVEIKPHEFREKPLDPLCDIEQNDLDMPPLDGEDPVHDPCGSVLIAETYWFDEMGQDPYITYMQGEEWN